MLINSLPDSSKQLFLELGKGTPVLKTIMGTVVRKAKKLVEVMSKFYGSLKKQYSEVDHRYSSWFQHKLYILLLFFSVLFI